MGTVLDFPTRECVIEVDSYAEELEFHDDAGELLIFRQPSTGKLFALDRRVIAAELAKA